MVDIARLQAFSGTCVSAGLLEEEFVSDALAYFDVFFGFAEG